MYSLSQPSHDTLLGPCPAKVLMVLFNPSLVIFTRPLIFNKTLGDASMERNNSQSVGDSCSQSTFSDILNTTITEIPTHKLDMYQSPQNTLMYTGWTSK